MNAELVCSRVLLACHGGFSAYDAGADLDEQWPPFTEESARRGWHRSRSVIHYTTVGEHWVIRLDVFSSREAPRVGAAARLLAHTLEIPSGHLVVGNTIAADNVAEIAVRPGRYALFLRAFNLGVEADLALDDPQRRVRTDLERYELYVVRGEAQLEGVVDGAAALW